MLTHKQIIEKSRELFRDMENSLNKIEEQIREAGDEMNKPAVSWHFGKVYSDYKMITELLEIYKE